MKQPGAADKEAVWSVKYGPFKTRIDRTSLIIAIKALIY